MKIIPFVAAFLLLPSLAAQEREFIFALGEVTAFVGGSFDLPVLADAPVPYQGFSCSVRYPTHLLAVEEVSSRETIIESIEADFVHGEAFPEQGIFNVAVLVDTLPPFDGQLIPAIGAPLPVGRARGRVLLTAPGEVTVAFESSAERPAIPNRFSVENLPVEPARLIPGRIIVEHPPRIPAFIRGDANLDSVIDISDGIYVLAWRFLGDPSPRCEDSADANSDDGLDVSDAIYILVFLFMDGERPLPPQFRPGPDFMPGELGCREPLEWLPERA